MEKKKKSIYKNSVISLRKPYKTIQIYPKNNPSQRIPTLINKDKSQDKMSENSNFSKISSISKKNKYSLIIKQKKDSKLINSHIKINKKFNQKLKIECNNIEKKNFEKIINQKISKKNSYNKIECNKSNFKTFSNPIISRNKKISKDTHIILNKNNFSMNLLSTNLRNKKKSIKTINSKNISMNNLNNRIKFQYNNNIKKRLLKSIITKDKINKIKFSNNLNHSNKNFIININDFKKFNQELLKRKIKSNKANNNLKSFNHTFDNIWPCIQPTIRNVKKESYINNKSENNSLDFLKKYIQNKNKNQSGKTIKKRINIIKRKDNKNIMAINPAKSISTNNLRNNIINFYNINQLNNYNNYQTNTLYLDYLPNINYKKINIFNNKTRNSNFNLIDINCGNNTTQNKTHKSLKKLNNNILNIKINNTINNILNINSSLNNLNISKYLNRNKNIIYNENLRIFSTKKEPKIETEIMKKLKKLSKKQIKYSNKNINKTEKTVGKKSRNKKNNIKNISLSDIKKKNKNKNEPKKTNHDLLYLNLIKINNIKKTRKYQSKKIINIQKIQNKVFYENLKKIRERRKRRKSNISFISKNNLKTNSNIKLNGLNTIFSNFYNINIKNFLLFNTPKGKIPCLFNNVNYSNISIRFNKTEEKFNFFIKNLRKKEENDLKNNFYINIKNNPQYSIEYIDEILQNLLIEENQFFEQFRFDYFNNNIKYCIHPENWKFFINSLINIQDMLNFSEYTIFSTILIFDKYISEILYEETNYNINVENLDIVIVTSLIIASKKEEIRLYPMKDYLKLLPDKYSIKDLIKQENDILFKFHFNLLFPNYLNFFEIFSVICKLDNAQIYKGLYILNLIMLDCKLLKIPPSLIAYCVVKIVCKKNIKNNIFKKIGYRYNDGNKIKEIKVIKILNDNNLINNICQYIQNFEKSIKLSNYDSVIKKFNTIKYYYAPSYAIL